jgi:hypothetical protein
MIWLVKEESAIKTRNNSSVSPGTSSAANIRSHTHTLTSTSGGSSQWIESQTLELFWKFYGRARRLEPLVRGSNLLRFRFCCAFERELGLIRVVSALGRLKKPRKMDIIRPNGAVSRYFRHFILFLPTKPYEIRSVNRLNTFQKAKKKHLCLSGSFFNFEARTRVKARAILLF